MRESEVQTAADGLAAQSQETAAAEERLRTRTLDMDERDAVLEVARRDLETERQELDTDRVALAQDQSLVASAHSALENATKRHEELELRLRKHEAELQVCAP